MQIMTRPLFAGLIALGAACGTVRAAAGEPPQAGSVAPDFSLSTIEGNKIRLSEMATKAPTVLVMLRGYPGYQCPFCTAQVGEYLGREADFRRAGGQVLLVYPGVVTRAQEFLKEKKLPANFTMAVDPDFSFTKQYHLRWDAPNETAYPATFVLDKKRVVRFAKISRMHGDRAKVDDVLKALMTITASRG
jgi:peroxiredoxin